MSYVFAFLAMTVLDFIWAEYTKAVAARATWRASLIGGLLFLLSGCMAIAYINNHWLLLPAALGSVCGTFLSMRYGSK